MSECVRVDRLDVHVPPTYIHKHTTMHIHTPHVLSDGVGGAANRDDVRATVGVGERGASSIVVMAAASGVVAGVAVAVLFAVGDP